MTGYTWSTDYDITPGVYQTAFGGVTDVFVTKLNPTGTGLIYSTYIGGSYFDYGYSIAIDGSGNAYLTGETYSTDYVITPGAYQTTYAGGIDVFVTKLNATGSDLIYSTYIGGSGYDFGYSIAIDAGGNAHVTGGTGSTDYDITPGAYQTTFGGGAYDVFVTKLNATGTALIYSTYIGGSDEDVANSITLEHHFVLKVYTACVTGYTKSTDYDITAGAYQTTNAGSRDVFVTKLNLTGTSLIYSTYLGGSSYDYGNSIAIDGSGNAYVTGMTGSTDYDITPGAYQTTNAGILDVFVTKLNTTGSGLIYSTYIGGSDDDRGYSITLDGSGNAYVTGYTISTDYDITPGAYQTTNAGILYVFVTKLNVTGSGLIYSTYIGGSDDDRGYSITLDGSGNAYVTGYTNSTDYDIIPGAYQTTNAGGTYDIFVTKLCPGLAMNSTLSSGAGTDNQTVCVNTPITNITYTTTGATGIGTPSGLPAGVSATYAGNAIFISGTPTASGTFNYSIPLTGGCGTVNATGTITVNPNNTVTLVSAPGTDNQTVCVNTSITNYIIYSTSGATGIGTPTGLPAGVTANWASNVLTISGTPTETGTFNYSIPLTGGCGNVSATGTITVNECLGIKTIDNVGSLINIFPNPSNGEFIISSETLLQQISVFDAMGNEVMSYRPQNTTGNINLSNMAEGVYWIRVTSEDGIGVKKLIITK